MNETASATIPLGPFRNEELADETRRDEIASQLQGVRWRMAICPGFKPKSAFTFLCHTAFPDHVFLPIWEFGHLAEGDALHGFSVLDVEVGLRFDERKQRWGLAAFSARVREELNQALQDLRRCASSWQNDEGAELARLQAVCLALDPDCQLQIEQAVELGKEDKTLLDAFYPLGRQFGANVEKRPEFTQPLAQLQNRRPDLVGKAREKARKGAAAATRAKESASRRKQGKPMSRIRTPNMTQAQSSTALPPVSKTDLPPTPPTHLHPRDLRAIAPQPTWQLLIDETGSEFGIEAGQLSKQDRTLGRFVGLLLPADGGGLAPLAAGWHAVDQGIDEIDQVVQAILDAPVGILGITVQQLPEAPGERWAFGIIRLVDLVLRLLPLDGPTQLEVLIEQRGRDFKGGTQWPAVAEQARLRLADAYPERARQVQLHIRTITKQGSPYNGYVDALAFIASGASEHSRACLAVSGLAGTCLLGGDAEFIGRMLEWMDRGRTLEGTEWTTLLAQDEADRPGSLVATLLERLGEAAARDVSLWRRYLDHLMGHFDSRSLDLKLLGRQTIWLERWRPSDQALPPLARLLWLTAQLARANHLGHTEQPWIEELRTLADQLFKEDAKLVCRAELNLAVTATNRFDFEQAGRALQRWNPIAAEAPGGLRGLMQKLLGVQPPPAGAQADPAATAGLRYWGQVRSSLGQHAAFLGDQAAAVRYFDEALASFAQLSDPEMQRREQAQTQIYRIIALMDDPACEATLVREAIEERIGHLSQALEHFAGSASNQDKYAHHLALRWLVHRPDPELTAVYLAHREDWEIASGHPWPLIQLYRGMLLHPQDAEAARELALDGAGIAFADESGPVVHLIGACCRTIAVVWGEPWPEAPARLDQLAVDLPLAKPRIERLRKAQQQPAEPLTLLREVLPFNFR